MAKEVVLIDGVQITGTSAVDSYTSPAAGNGTRIISFTASKVAAGTVTYRVFIGATAVVAKEVIPATPISGPDHDTPLGLITAFIPPGEKLFVQVSTTLTIAFRASGLEF